MKMSCETVQDLLPDLASGRIEAGDRAGAEAHVATCMDCRATLETLRLLGTAPPPVPGDLESRIQAAVAGRFSADSPARGTAARPARPFWRRPAPAWGLAAAAVLALVLGRSLGPDDSGDLEILAMGQDDVLMLMPDDGMVAGGPLLDGLSDEDLALLLEELDR